MAVGGFEDPRKYNDEYARNEFNFLNSNMNNIMNQMMQGANQNYKSMGWQGGIQSPGTKSAVTQPFANVMANNFLTNYNTANTATLNWGANTRANNQDFEFQRQADDAQYWREERQDASERAKKNANRNAQNPWGSALGAIGGGIFGGALSQGNPVAIGAGAQFGSYLGGGGSQNYYAQGGLPNNGRPALLVDLLTGEPTGIMNEEAPELIIPLGRPSKPGKAVAELYSSQTPIIKKLKAQGEQVRRENMTVEPELQAFANGLGVPQGSYGLGSIGFDNVPNVPVGSSPGSGGFWDMVKSVGLDQLKSLIGGDNKEKPQVAQMPSGQQSNYMAAMAPNPSEIIALNQARGNPANNPETQMAMGLINGVTSGMQDAGKMALTGMTGMPIQFADGGGGAGDSRAMRWLKDSYHKTGHHHDDSIAKFENGTGEGEIPRMPRLEDFSGVSNTEYYDNHNPLIADDDLTDNRDRRNPIQKFIDWYKVTSKEEISKREAKKLLVAQQARDNRLRSSTPNANISVLPDEVPQFGNVGKDIEVMTPASSTTPAKVQAQGQAPATAPSLEEGNKTPSYWAKVLTGLEGSLGDIITNYAPRDLHDEREVAFGLKNRHVPAPGSRGEAQSLADKFQAREEAEIARRNKILEQTIALNKQNIDQMNAESSRTTATARMLDTMRKMEGGDADTQGAKMASVTALNKNAEDAQTALRQNVYANPQDAIDDLISIGTYGQGTGITDEDRVAAIKKVLRAGSDSKQGKVQLKGGADRVMFAGNDRTPMQLVLQEAQAANLPRNTGESDVDYATRFLMTRAQVRREQGL